MHSLTFFRGEFQLWEDTKTKEIEDLKAELRVKSLGISKRLQFFLEGAEKWMEFLNFFQTDLGNASFSQGQETQAALESPGGYKPTEMDER